MTPKIRAAIKQKYGLDTAITYCNELPLQGKNQALYSVTVSPKPNTHISLLVLEVVTDRTTSISLYEHAYATTTK
jgi:hypothetical protein